MEKAYKEYAAIMAKISDLEKERDELKGVLIEKLKDEPENKKKFDWGNFTLAFRKNWSYSDKVKAMEEKVKIAKDKEQKKGIAKATVTEFVMFTIPKE